MPSEFFIFNHMLTEHKIKRIWKELIKTGLLHELTSYRLAVSTKELKIKSMKL